jgi:splicing factor 3A subunit 1
MEVESPADIGAEGPQSGKIVGVIIPPPDIRVVIDKTSKFVADHGKRIEQRIAGSEEGKTAKFNFLKANDPYHAYYELRIRQFEEEKAGNGSAPTASSSKPATEVGNEGVSPSGGDAIDKREAAAVTQKDSAAAAAAPIISAAKSVTVTPIARAVMRADPNVQPPPLDFLSLSPSINTSSSSSSGGGGGAEPGTGRQSVRSSGASALKLDVMKLTARHTAAGGRDFLAAVAKREVNNPDFDFLRPTHMLFGHFTDLVDAYAKILQRKSRFQAGRETRYRSNVGVLEVLVACLPACLPFCLSPFLLVYSLH